MRINTYADRRFPSRIRGPMNLRSLGILLVWMVRLGQTSAQGEVCQAGSVLTGAGEVCGKTVKAEGRTLSVFLGIPYAESTAGERR